MPRQPKNLAGKDLRNVNLSTDDLRAADLSHTSLSGAFLRGVDLTDADLSDADLRGAHLEGADLGGTNLHNADLADADVRGAKIENAAVLDGVRLENAKGVPDDVQRKHPAPLEEPQETGESSDEANMPRRSSRPDG